MGTTSEMISLGCFDPHYSLELGSRNDALYSHKVDRCVGLERAMESSFWGTVSQHRLKKNITLLRLLGKEPERPAEYPIPQHLCQPGESFSRQLTIERERSLVDTLAFISAPFDDPTKVIAICVEEHEGRDSMTIRIAANSGDLQPTKEALRRISSILERVASTGNCDDTSGALKGEIITLNRDRVLSRLRSNHAVPSVRNLNKAPTVVRLAEIVDVLRALASIENDLSGAFEDVEVKVKELQSLYGRLEAMTKKQVRSNECQSILEDIVRVAYSLASQNNLSRLLQSVPNSGRFKPGAKSSLLTAIGKLGRYYSSCTFLTTAARKLTIFKMIQVEIVRLSVPVVPSTLPPAPIQQSQPSLLETLAQILGVEPEVIKQTTAQSPTITRDMDIVSMEAKFSHRLSTSPKSYKIHAEIQLLFFYEMHADRERPRVICSSKSACFLCDLFIRIHAKFDIARTHGVLYDKWRLPDPRVLSLRAAEMTAMAKIVETFNAAVEDKIRSALLIPRLRCYHPNESLFMEPQIWSSSAGSVVNSTTSHVNHHSSGIENAMREVSNPTRQSLIWQPLQSHEREFGRVIGSRNESELEHVDLPSAEDFDELKRTSTRSRCPSENTSRTDIPNQRLSKASRSTDSLDASSSTSSSTRRADIITPGYQLLNRGDWFKKILPINKLPVIVGTESMRLILSYDWTERTDQDASAERLFLLKARWLESNEEYKRYEGSVLETIDVDELRECVNETTSHGAADSSTELFIRRQADVISIKFIEME